MTRAARPGAGVRTGTVRPGRLLLGLYLLLAVAAGGRSIVQLVTGSERAPLAHGLSAAAAVVYAVGVLMLHRAARGSSRARSLAACWCVLELVGVLGVGTVGIVAPSVLGAATVWSGFGAGYLFLPLALPVGALVWLVGLPVAHR